MAFKKRNSTAEQSTKDSKVNSTKTNEKIDFPKYTPDKIKTFREQAILVLNILEAKGINIYDENRTAGMYLKGKNKSSKNLVNRLLSNNANDTNNSSNTENKSNLIAQLTQK